MYFIFSNNWYLIVSGASLEKVWSQIYSVNLNDWLILHHIKKLRPYCQQLLHIQLELRAWSSMLRGQSLKTKFYKHYNNGKNYCRKNFKTLEGKLWLGKVITCSRSHWDQTDSSDIIGTESICSKACWDFKRGAAVQDSSANHSSNALKGWIQAKSHWHPTDWCMRPALWLTTSPEPKIPYKPERQYKEALIQKAVDPQPWDQLRLLGWDCL